MTICDLSDETGIDPHNIIKKFQKIGIFRKKKNFLAFEQTVNSKYSNEIKIYDNGNISWSKNSDVGRLISEVFKLDNRKYLKPEQNRYIKHINVNIQQTEEDTVQDDWNSGSEGIFPIWKKEAEAEAQHYNNDNGCDCTEMELE